MVVIGFVGVPLLELSIGYKGYFPLYDNSPAKILVKVGEYLFFLPQIGAYFGSYVTGIGQLWSIGIEETFYLVWPVLFRRFLPSILRVLVGIIVIKLLIWIIYLLLPSATPSFLRQLVGLVVFIRVENMAVGGLGAYILFTKREQMLKIIF